MLFTKVCANYHISRHGLLLLLCVRGFVCALGHSIQRLDRGALAARAAKLGVEGVIVAKLFANAYLEYSYSELCVYHIRVSVYEYLLMGRWNRVFSDLCAEEDLCVHRGIAPTSGPCPRSMSVGPYPCTEQRFKSQSASVLGLLATTSLHSRRLALLSLSSAFSHLWNTSTNTKHAWFIFLSTWL